MENRKRPYSGSSPRRVSSRGREPSCEGRQPQEQQPADGILNNICGGKRPRPNSAACPAKKPECPSKAPEKQQQPGCGPDVPKKEASEACGKSPRKASKCKRAGRKSSRKRKTPKSRNPFIIFFLEMWYGNPCGKVSEMAKKAAKCWNAMAPKDKEPYCKLAKKEQMKMKRKCGRSGKRKKAKRKHRSASRSCKKRRPKKASKCKAKRKPKRKC